MYKIIIFLLCFFLSGCIATYPGIGYETSNTIIIRIKKKPLKQTFNIFISARDNEQFEEIINNIMESLCIKKMVVK